MKSKRVMKNAINIRKQVREKGEAKLRKWDMFGDSYYYDPSVVPNNYDSLRPVFGKGNVGIRSKVRGCNTSVKSYIRKDPKLKKRLVEHLKKDELGTFEYSKCSPSINLLQLFSRKKKSYIPGDKIVDMISDGDTKLHLTRARINRNPDENESYGRDSLSQFKRIRGGFDGGVSTYQARKSKLLGKDLNDIREAIPKSNRSRISELNVDTNHNAAIDPMNKVPRKLRTPVQELAKVDSLSQIFNKSRLIGVNNTPDGKNVFGLLTSSRNKDVTRKHDVNEYRIHYDYDEGGIPVNAVTILKDSGHKSNSKDRRVRKILRAHPEKLSGDVDTLGAVYGTKSPKLNNSDVVDLGSKDVRDKINKAIKKNPHEHDTYVKYSPNSPSVWDFKMKNKPLKTVAKEILGNNVSRVKEKVRKFRGRNEVGNKYD